MYSLSCFLGVFAEIVINLAVSSVFALRLLFNL